MVTYVDSKNVKIFAKGYRGGNWSFFGYGSSLCISAPERVYQIWNGIIMSFY